ncbi:unnamed protein product [Paramecium primaurelia]|uniref:Aquaporin n=1 Tax=Paramecium primaurelia TaxID=5886 RepID=A0A8S1KAZ7_PARPR|nr:unnamed protein product [Paramecium primaurelia]
MPQTKVGQIKKEAIYIFWFEFIGTFMLTFCIYASIYDQLKLNNNLYVFACAYGLLILVAQHKKCTFNPAITTVLSGLDKGLQVSVAIGSQFGGAFLARIFEFLCFKNYVNDVPYISQTNIEAYMAMILGVIFGSFILCSGFLFQHDDIMGLSSDQIDQNIAQQSVIYTVLEEHLVMQLRVVLIQLLHSVFFECCKDGHWARIWNLWIYSILPYFGAFFSLAIIRIIYRDCYEQQLQVGLRQ